MKKILINTEVLVFGDTTKSENYKACDKIISLGLEKNFSFFLAYDSFFEYFRILSSKTNLDQDNSSNGLQKIVQNLDFYLENKNIKILYPNKKTLKLSLELSQKYNLTGLKILNLKFLALALEHNLDTIITQNTQDFVDIKENVEILKPQDYLNQIN